MASPGIRGYCSRCQWRFRCPIEFKGYIYIQRMRYGDDMHFIIPVDGIERIGPLACVKKYKEKKIIQQDVFFSKNLTVQMRVKLRKSFRRRWRKENL